MSHHRKLFVVTAFALAAVAAHAFLGCSPEHISDTATVTLRFNPDDSGVGGFQCVQPRSTPVCDALRACEDVGDVRSCFMAACRNRACDPSLIGCLGSASDGGASSRKAINTCLQNACATPALASAPKMAVIVDFLRLDGFPSCLPNYLRAWCRERRGTPGACQPLPNERRCVDIALPPPTASKATDQANELGRAFVSAIADAGVIDESAPNDQYVIVRVTAVDVDGGCAAMTDTTKSLVAPDRRLLGCARSCPVKLDVNVDVAVDFEDPTCSHLEDCADLQAEPATEP